MSGHIVAKKANEPEYGEDWDRGQNELCVLQKWEGYPVLEQLK
jgi:hypothetical protein